MKKALTVCIGAAISAAGLVLLSIIAWFGIYATAPASVPPWVALTLAICFQMLAIAVAAILGLATLAAARGLTADGAR